MVESINRSRSLAAIVFVIGVGSLALACADVAEQPFEPEALSAEACIICDDGSTLDPGIETYQWVGAEHNIRLDSALQVTDISICDNTKARALELVADSPHLVLEEDVTTAYADSLSRAAAGCDGPPEVTLSFVVDSMSAHLGSFAGTLLRDIESATVNYADLSSYVADIETVEVTADTYLSGTDRDVILATASLAKSSASYWSTELGDASLAADGGDPVKADVTGCIATGIIVGIIAGRPLAGCIVGGLANSAAEWLWHNWPF